MDKSQLKLIKELKQTELHHSKEWLNYWLKYSSFDNWHFWVVLALLIIPLIVLLFLMDKKKSLLLGFYGYSVHMIFTYVDVYGANNTFWFYPYKAFPILPSNLSLDASLVPVSYMLVYQWTMNHHKNYYLGIFGLSIGFAFIFKPIMETLRLFEFGRGANFLHLLIAYLFVGVAAKQVTNLFLYLQNKSKKDQLS